MLQSVAEGRAGWQDGRKGRHDFIGLVVLHFLQDEFCLSHPLGKDEDYTHCSVRVAEQPYDPDHPDLYSDGVYSYGRAALWIQTIERDL